MEEALKVQALIMARSDFLDSLNLHNSVAVADNSLYQSFQFLQSEEKNLEKNQSLIVITK